MFVGRKEELAQLEKRYNSNEFQFPVIYGRRRVGKSYIIKHFMSDKKGIYYVATEQDERIQLANISDAIRTQYDSDIWGNFSDWNNLFDYIAKQSASERMIFVIDEFPYLAKVYPAISSVLQKYIDEKFLNGKLFLILCGSSMSFMEKQVLGYESPLYGRRTAQIKLLPMKYYEAIQFFENWKDEEKLYAYGMCGGIPQYLKYFSKHKSLRSAVTEEFLEADGHLREETDILLKQELREPAVYNSILSAIAHGKNKQIEIADAIGKGANQLVSYLNNLISLNIIKKILPVGETNNKKSIYVIADNLFLFYYFFVIDSMSMLAVRDSEDVYEEKILPFLPDYFGHIFEDICIEYLEHQMKNGSIKELYVERGKWWGTNPATKQQEEIDILFAGDGCVLMGECKWRAKKVGMDVYNTLLDRADIVRKSREACFYLFSRAGFEERLVEESRNVSNLVLVELGDIVYHNNL